MALQIWHEKACISFCGKISTLKKPCKTVYLKIFKTCFKTVSHRGPCPMRPCPMRPYCTWEFIKVTKIGPFIYSWFSLRTDRPMNVTLSKSVLLYVLLQLRAGNYNTFCRKFNFQKLFLGCSTTVFIYKYFLTFFYN